MAEPFLAEIIMFGGNFNPRGWALCDGQLLPIAQNSALFSLLGTMYGGDGRTTFGLPGLRGRVPVHAGTGPGLSPRRLGEKGGSQTNTLITAQLPAHNHTGTVKVSGKNGNTDTPVGSYLAVDQGGAQPYRTALANEGNLNGLETNLTGGGQSVNNMQPFIVINYIIALQGVFPSRS